VDIVLVRQLSWFVRLPPDAIDPTSHAVQRASKKRKGAIEKEIAIPAIPACFEGNKSITLAHMHGRKQ